MCASCAYGPVWSNFSFLRAPGSGSGGAVAGGVYGGVGGVRSASLSSRRPPHGISRRLVLVQDMPTPVALLPIRSVVLLAVAVTFTSSQVSHQSVSLFQFHTDMPFQARLVHHMVLPLCLRSMLAAAVLVEAEGA